MPIGSGGNEAARRHLQRDPVLRDLMRRVGPCRLATRDEGTHFEALVRSIIYQQLSGKAARTIHERVIAALGEVTPERIAATGDETLRTAGLSRQKVAYLRDLAARARLRQLPLDTVHELHDDALIEALSSVKGIGRWTAHMFLIFRLGRPDVLPELDLGVRKAVQRAYRLRALPTPKRLTSLGAKWTPYRSVAAWYLWRSLDLPDVKREAAAPGRRKTKAARRKTAPSPESRPQTRRAKPKV